MTGKRQFVGPKWGERLRALANFRPLAKLVWEAAPEIVILELATRAVAALLPLAMLWITKYIIDAITNYTKHAANLPQYFWWLVVLEFGLASLGTILARATDFCDTVLADRYARYISTRIMEHGSKLDLASYEDPVFYDKMERARVQGTDRIVMIQASGRLFQQFLTTASLAAGIIKFSPLLFLGLVVCVVPAFLGETHFAFLGYSLNFHQTPAKREMEYLRILGGSKESAKELKLFGLGPFFVRRYTEISNALHNENVSLAKRKLLIGAFLTLLGTTGYYGTYAYVIYKTISGALTIGTLVFLAGAISGASTNIQQLFSTFSSIADQALFMADLLEFFEMKPRIVSKPNALPVPRPIQRGLEFRNVSFAYPGNSRLILKDINFTIRPSERIALVGENGQGKTTIVKLLTRLYEATSGQILLDGIDIREYDLEDLWREVGVIFQDFVRYEMTAAKNIGLGHIEHCDDEMRIRAAARKSFADAVIRRLPKGFQQTLGVRFEGGVELSGGEWQRIALARAYLRDAQILILDEPTAALDARSEHDLFQRFADLTAQKMSVLISHRFSTVRMADRILVLENGQIAEQGPHEELVKYGGRYAEMFELQASNYR
ncbi:MAG TPA: ABC transporter ATP-binding protein [Terriglobia bacterium]|nr:ABC transporter ATP-binding protein [Terriglobia bacterium]